VHSSSFTQDAHNLLKFYAHKDFFNTYLGRLNPEWGELDEEAWGPGKSNDIENTDKMTQHNVASEDTQNKPHVSHEFHKVLCACGFPPRTHPTEIKKL